MQIRKKILTNQIRSDHISPPRVTSSRQRSISREKMPPGQAYTILVGSDFFLVLFFLSLLLFYSSHSSSLFPFDRAEIRFKKSKSHSSIAYADGQMHQNEAHSVWLGPGSCSEWHLVRTRFGGGPWIQYYQYTCLPYLERTNPQSSAGRTAGRSVATTVGSEVD